MRTALSINEGEILRFIRRLLLDVTEVLTKGALIHPINRVLITTIRGGMERKTKGVKVDTTTGTTTTARISLQLRACLIVLYFVILLFHC